ncbi:MAG TPA: FG-GAP-like repeat-containing protein [Pyrinomonadaceae bacterium]|nr:FG-GAP-like repeat-containing protein [Pyrinomonadaceae bacterium]
MRNILFTLLFAVSMAAFAQMVTTPSAAQTQASGPSALIRWNIRTRARRFRLQLARDARFTDIVFDRAIEGREYLVTELPAGKYFWRVAPATPETGTFTRPAPIEITIPTVIATPTPQPRVTPTPIAPRVLSPGDSGWRTATGDVRQPVVAPLRSTSDLDLVGVNSDGMVYAIDGSNGVALWTARFRPKAKTGEPTGNGGASPFTPVIIRGDAGLAHVVSAFEGGVHALNGATGRELWRTSLQGRAASGAVADIDGDGKLEIIIAEDNSPALAILNDAGKFVAEVKLDAAVTGAPVPFVNKDERGILLSLENGLIDLRSAVGERVRAVKLDTKPTTPPIVVQGTQGPLVLVGVEGNLIALNLVDLKALGRIETEHDAPRGTLKAVDLDMDGKQEVVMITRLGKTVVVGAADGKIKWYAPGATDAASAAFADVNGDGALDVLVAGGNSFAVGFSGRDGSLIWKAEEGGTSAPSKSQTASMRGMVTATASDGTRAILVGSDSQRTGLRAVDLPRGSVKTAIR